MSENKTSGAPRLSSAADALADLKKQRSNSTSYNRPSNQSNNNNNSDDDGCLTIFFWIIGICIGVLLFSMM